MAMTPKPKPFRPGDLARLLNPKESSPVPNQNMGRIQKAEPHWRTFGDSTEKESNYYKGPEWADRLEREAHGRPLVAAYRHILGPNPTLLAGDTAGARAFLGRIEKAVELGGWTRSEWTRLRRLRTKWKARAEGRDGRFKEVGNKSGGLPKYVTVNVKQRQIVEDMRQELDNAYKSTGD